ncbi:MAG: LPS export ABC transporter permease LptF [Gammaproteobacteria bacterium]|nr:LPS export ABC transporter permease LptF [Gammaproteobacteria bacterium]
MIIARYLIKEIAQTLFGVLLVLMLIGLSAQLVSLFAEVTAGNLSINTVMVLFGLKALKMLLVILPLSLYLAVLMRLSQFYQNNEMAAISASGISQIYILRIVLSFSVLFSILVGILSLQVVPWANNLQQDIVIKSESSSSLEGMIAGRFKEMSSGAGVMYVEKINDEQTRLDNVFIQRKLKKGESITRAKYGSQVIDDLTGDRYLVLDKGVRFEGQPGKKGFTIIAFEEQGIRISEKSAVNVQKKYSAMLTMELLKGKSVTHTSELHSRIAPILLCLLLSALAIPLSHTSPRQGRYTRLGIGLVIYLVFSNLVYVGKNWINLGKISPELGLWWIHAILLLLVVFLFMQQTGFKYLFGKNIKGIKG